MKGLPHLIWALVAMAAFFFGFRWPDDQGDQPASRGGEARTRITREWVRSARQNPEASRSSRRSRLRDSEIARAGALSLEDLAELGRTFKEGNLVERRLAFAEILKNLTPENALALREHVADLPQDSPEFREFHYAWGAVAGDEAISHGKDTPKRDMAAALAGWASADPSAALAYFDGLSPEEQNNGALMKWGAVFGLADADPQLAAEFARRRFQEGDKDAPKMINIAAATVLRTGDREEATQWAERVPEGELQNAAFQQLANEFAREDTAEAVAWATALPEGEAKGHAVGSSFHQWANRDPEGAAQAIAALPTSQQDAATFGYATSVVHKEPAVGVQWAATIADAEARKRALIDTGRVFYRRDRNAAREWLSSVDLSEEAVQQITGEK